MVKLKKMKKILFLAALFLVSISHSQTVKGFVGSDGTFVPLEYVGGNTADGGGANPNITIVTSTSDITTAGVGASVEFRTPFSLSTNYTPPANQTWYFTTGKLDLLAYKLTGLNTTLVTNGKKIAIDAFDGEIDGTWEKGSDFYTTNFGMIYDNSVSTDNQKSLKAALNVINNTGGTLITPKGHAYASAFLPSQYLRDNPQNGYVIGSFGNNVKFIAEGESIIEVIPNDYQNYVFFMISETAGSTIQGVTLLGDRYEHTYSVKFRVPTAATSSGNLILTDVNTGVIHTIPVTASTAAQNRIEIRDYFQALPSYTSTIENKIYTTDAGDVVVRPTTPGLFEDWYLNLNINSNGTGIVVTLNDATHEFGHGLRIFNNAINVTVENNKIWNFTGDSMSNSNDNQFQTFLTDANYTIGSKIDKDGNIVVDAGWMYSTPVDVTGSNFVEAPWFYYRGGSYGGSAGLQTWEYYAAYYDETDTFIEMSPLLDFYKRVDLKPEYKFVRITSRKGTGEPITTQLAPSKVGFNVVIKNNDLGWSRRQGISNAHANTHIIGNYIHDIGTSLPSFGIDIEDNYRFLFNIVIEGNRFKNNYKGDIILKQCEQVRILNNFFEASTRADFFGITTNNILDTPAISCETARSTIITANHFSGKNVELGRSSMFNGNEMNNGRMNLYREYPSLSNNTFRDTQIYYGGSLALSDQRNGTVWMDNNKFYITKPWDNSFVYDIGTVSYNSTKFIFNEIVDLGYGTTEDITRLESGGALMYAFRTTPVAVGTKGFGEYKEFVIQDLKASVANRGGDTGVNLYVNDMNGDSKISCSFNIRHGLPKDFKIQDTYVNGGIRLYLDQFTSTNSSLTNSDANLTATIEDVIFEITDVEDLNNSTDEGIFVDAKDVNLYFKNTTFKVDVPIVGKWFDFQNYGNITFDNCTWISANSTNIDFSTFANIGDVKVINATTSNVTLSNVTTIVDYSNLVITKTQIEYDALSIGERNNGKLYIIQN